uniref:Uncharacterized protein n=1 Tax=Anguilla anguilla TaxID=7936 RepID=A0A0E9S2S6_ANGAN
MSICGYGPMHNPPLEVTCPFINGGLVQGPPAAFRGRVWIKNSVHLDTSIPAKERKCDTLTQV